MGICLEQERQAIIGLSLVTEIGPRRFKNLMDRFGSGSAVLAAGATEIAAVEDILPRIAGKIAGPRLLDEAGREIEKARASGAEIITCADDGYPEAFRNIPDSPIVIYVRGKISEEDSLSVAIVGTRHPTSYGRAAAERFSREFADCGVTTVSGLARGIDTEVHCASVSAGARTIAVLGNGLNRHYPPENRKLEDKIVRQGALISEFAMDVSPDRGNFPRRNRLISAFSLATLVVEADEKSGALITAKYSAEQGKDVFALPGPVFSIYSRGPHMLIKQGAHLAETASDIFEEIKPLAEALRKSRLKADERPMELPAFEGVEEKIMEMLENDFNGVSADRLSAALKLSPAEIFPSLTILEIKGFIRCLPGKAYIRNIK